MKPIFSLFILLSSLISQAEAKSNWEYVDVFIGSSGDHGQVDPGATVPFGMIHLAPDSDPRQHAGYDDAVSRIKGISINRLSGVGCRGAGGNILLRPEDFGKALHLIKDSEQAAPGYYQAKLDNGVAIKLTASQKVALEQFDFTQAQQAALFIDFSASFDKFFAEEHIVDSDHEIHGWLRAANVCGHGSYQLYFNLKSNQAFQIESDRNHQLKLRFSPQAQQPVELRIALSSVSHEQAREENLRLESEPFQTLQNQAIQAWKEKLNRIEVEGDEAEKTLFYTSLYRAYLSPANVTSAAGDYLGTDGNLYHADQFTYYSSWSLWDTFRTKFPLLTLTEPELMSDFSQSLVKLYQTGKKNWSSDHEATPTVRTEHAMILLLDAYQKGIRGIQLADAYPGMQAEAAQLAMKTPDQRLEASYDLWVLARIAELLGKTEDANHYRQQSESLFADTWQKEFMNIDDSFGQMKGNGLYQGTRWQYRWAAPQYLDKMIDLVGGVDRLRAELSTFFDQYQYNQGNEPDIHVPFLFNQLGAPEQSQKLVLRLLTDETMIHRFGGNAEFPQPYIGRAFKKARAGFMAEMDEDDGAMGAWFVFAAMGLYPVKVGEPEYEILSPLFDKITLHLQGGKQFIISTRHRKKREDPIRSITLNGQAFSGYQLPHAALVKGGSLLLNYQD